MSPAEIKVQGSAEGISGYGGERGAVQAPGDEGAAISVPVVSSMKMSVSFIPWDGYGRAGGSFPGTAVPLFIQS